MRKKLPPLAVYPNRVTALVLVAVCVALIAAPVVAVQLFRVQIEETRLLSFRLYAVVWIGIGLFFILGCLGLLVNFRRLLFPRPVVTISPDGIEPLWFGLLGWKEIDHPAKVQRKGQWLLGIFPKDTEDILSRQGPVNRALMRQAIHQGFPALYLTQLALPMTIDQLLAEIRRYADIRISGSAG
jgi:hypothetical protein